jgi:hypothetical protein
MTFSNLLDDPLFGAHCPLVLRWSNDQGEPLVRPLAPLLSDNLTDRMLSAVAAIARSLVTEKMISGGGVHYARAKDPYSRPQRYRDGDPLFTWHYVTHAMDALRDAGLIQHTTGLWYPYHQGWQSVACATDKLMTLIGPLIDVSERRGISKRVETIVLRDRADKTDVDYEDTADTEAMREQVRLLNDNLGQLKLRNQGQKCDIPLGRRVFNGSFDRGGRFYCHGSSFQNLPAQARRELELLMDGVVHPLVELDYCNLHITMAYSEAGEAIPDSDQYTIDGFHRGLVKVAVNTLFNASSIHSGILAITEELRDQAELRAASGIESSNRSPCRALAEEVVPAIQHKHHRIDSYFGSDCGARFQRTDSDMAMEVMTRMVDKTGRCPLPVHDSFLVPQMDAEVLGEIMVEVAGDYGLQLGIKNTGAS